MKKLFFIFSFIFAFFLFNPLVVGADSSSTIQGYNFDTDSPFTYEGEVYFPLSDLDSPITLSTADKLARPSSSGYTTEWAPFSLYPYNLGDIPYAYISLDHKSVPSSYCDFINTRSSSSIYGNETYLIGNNFGSGLVSYTISLNSECNYSFITSTFNFKFINKVDFVYYYGGLGSPYWDGKGVSEITLSYSKFPTYSQTTLSYITDTGGDTLSYSGSSFFNLFIKENGEAVSDYDLGFNAGYSRGDTDGYNRGYSEGYNLGKDRGYKDGYNAGLEAKSGDYDTGYLSGYNAGYDIGYDTGSSEYLNSGYDAGFDSGYDAGYSEGYNSGYTSKNSGWDTLFYSSFLSVFSIFNIEILPNLTIGMLVGFPLLLGLITFFIGAVTGSSRSGSGKKKRGD